MPLATRELSMGNKLSLFGTVKAKSRVGDVPLTGAVIPALERVLADSRFVKPDALMFCTDKGTPLEVKRT